MLFLLNAVVVRTPLTLELPRGLESLVSASPASVLTFGVELYAKHPRLEYDRLDIARWYCCLLQLRFPDAGAARFRPTSKGYLGELANVPLPHLVQLLSLQDRGVSIAPEVEDIWTRVSQMA
jgi:hypothetical protein